MADLRMKARGKKVQKMTKNGLVEENLAENSTVRVSNRAGEMKLKRKNHLGADERMGSSRHAQQSRDAPVTGRRKKKQAAKLQTQKQRVGEGKFLEKERHLSASRGDSRKDENGGTKRPQQKRRLQFAKEETGAADKEKADTTKANTAKANAKKTSMKEHSKKSKNVQHEPDAIGKKQSKLTFENGGNIADKGKKLAGAAAGMTSTAIHRKIAESEDENAAVKGLHDLELGAEKTGRLAQRSVRSSNRQNQRSAARKEAKTDKRAVNALYQKVLSKNEKVQRSSLLKKQIQKARIKREYAKAKRAEQTMGTATKGTVDYIKKIGGKVTNFFKENRKVYISIGVLVAMMFLITTCLTSCSAVFLHNLVNYSGGSYMSTDEAIRDEGLSETGGESNFQKASKPSHEQKEVKIYDEQKRISAVFTGDNQRLFA